MSRENMAALMTDLAMTLGIEGLTLEDDQCSIRTQDGALNLDLDYIDAGDLIVLSCPLGPVEMDRRKAVLSTMLKANCLPGDKGRRMLSLDASGEALLQSQESLLDVADFPSFYAALESFVTDGEEWIAHLRTPGLDADASREGAPPPDAGAIIG